MNLQELYDLALKLDALHLQVVHPATRIEMIMTELKKLLATPPTME